MAKRKEEENTHKQTRRKQKSKWLLFDNSKWSKYNHKKIKCKNYKHEEDD